jgi:hypothetical protein
MLVHKGITVEGGFMLHLAGLVAAFVLGCAAGYWLHYRFGSAVASTVAQIETDVKGFGKPKT